MELGKGKKDKGMMEFWRWAAGEVKRGGDEGGGDLEMVVEEGNKKAGRERERRWGLSWKKRGEKTREIRERGL